MHAIYKNAINILYRLYRNEILAKTNSSQFLEKKYSFVFR